MWHFFSPEDTKEEATPVNHDNSIVSAQLTTQEAGWSDAAAPEEISMLSGVVKTFYAFLSCLHTRTQKREEELGGDGVREVCYDQVEELNWIGQGASGSVFLGTYRGERVAIKKFKDFRMTVKEMRNFRTLAHKNIVLFKGVCTQPPVYCLLMEWCSKSLYDMIQEQQILPPMLLSMATDIASGMHYLHSRHVVHRDLKSPNILLAQDGTTLKISDFGTCRYNQSKTTNMSFIGTVAWMAPEMIRNEPCSFGVDIWSFGVVLWELLAGEIPYKGVDPGAIIFGVGSERMHLPVPSTAPEGFVLLLKQCFNAHPKHRPQFRQILLHLDILANDFADTPGEAFLATQSDWKEEITLKFQAMKTTPPQVKIGADSSLTEDLGCQQAAETQHVQSIRLLLEEQVIQVANLINTLSTKEQELQSRENELRALERQRTRSHPRMRRAWSGSRRPRVLRRLSAPALGRAPTRQHSQGKILELARQNSRQALAEKEPVPQSDDSGTIDD